MARPIPIHTIITHVGADLDGIYAAWLLQSWGEKLFPGVSNASWEFVDAGSTNHRGLNAEELEVEGYIALDVLGGRFDHHAVGNQPSKPNECAATLVAKYLGLEDRPEIELLLGYVRSHDLMGTGQPTDLASRLRRLYRNGGTELEAISLAYDEFELDYADQSRHFATAVEEYSHAGFTTVTVEGGQQLKIAAIQSDNEVLSRVSRSKRHGQGVAVLIKKDSNGRVVILPVPRFNLDLKAVSGMIRLAEAKARGIKVESIPMLCRPGTDAEVPQWYYFRSTDGRDVGLMNGGPKNQNVSPTCLEMSLLVELVASGLQLSHNPSLKAA